MPTNHCKYYRSKTEIFRNKEIRSSRSALKPESVSYEWCIHENSPLRQNESGELICHGDVNRCPFGGDREMRHKK